MIIFMDKYTALFAMAGGSVFVVCLGAWVQLCGTGMCGTMGLVHYIICKNKTNLIILLLNRSSREIRERDLESLLFYTGVYTF